MVDTHCAFRGKESFTRLVGLWARGYCSGPLGLPHLRPSTAPLSGTITILLLQASKRGTNLRDYGREPGLGTQSRLTLNHKLLQPCQHHRSGCRPGEVPFFAHRELARGAVGQVCSASIGQARQEEGSPGDPASLGPLLPAMGSLASQGLYLAGPGPRQSLWNVLGATGTFGILRQHGVEAAQRGELQGEAERVDADAYERHDAGVL